MVERWQQSSAELLRAVRELESRMRRDYGSLLDIVAELESRDAHCEVGYPDLPELLRATCRITLREARRRLQHTHALTETPLVSGGSAPAPLPATADAVRAGVLGADHVEVIGRALTGLPPHVPPAAIAEAEQTLVAAATSMDARTLSRVGERVRVLLDQDGSPPADTELANPTNELHLMTRANGRTVFRGELEPEASALFSVLLSPLAKPRPSSAEGPDPRTPAERNGDALADLLRLAADHVDLPAEAGTKPHLLVTIPLQALREASGTGLLTGAGYLDAASARRLACDARVIPAVLGTASEPLDLGRAAYIVSTAVRRALVLRDGGCAFPDCHRPSGWCHSHHINHWAMPLGERRHHQPGQPCLALMVPPSLGP